MGYFRTRHSTVEIKKGAGASPLLSTDPQNQNTVEVVFRPPREANILFDLLSSKSGASPNPNGTKPDTTESIGLMLREL